MRFRTGLLVLAFASCSLWSPRAEADLPDASLTNCGGSVSCPDGEFCQTDPSSGQDLCAPACSIQCMDPNQTCFNNVCYDPPDAGNTAEAGTGMTEAGTTGPDGSINSDASATVDAIVRDVIGTADAVVRDVNTRPDAIVQDTGTVNSDGGTSTGDVIVISDVVAIDVPTQGSPCTTDDDCHLVTCQCSDQGSTCDPTAVLCTSGGIGCPACASGLCTIPAEIGCLCMNHTCQIAIGQDSGVSDDVVTPPDDSGSTDTDSGSTDTDSGVTDNDAGEAQDSGVTDNDASSSIDGDFIDPNNSGPSFRGGACKCHVAAGAGTHDGGAAPALGAMGALALALAARRRAKKKP